MYYFIILPQIYPSKYFSEHYFAILNDVNAPEGQVKSCLVIAAVVLDTLASSSEKMIDTIQYRDLLLKVAQSLIPLLASTEGIEQPHMYF